MVENNQKKGSLLLLGEPIRVLDETIFGWAYNDAELIDKLNEDGMSIEKFSEYYLMYLLGLEKWQKEGGQISESGDFVKGDYKMSYRDKEGYEYCRLAYEEMPIKTYFIRDINTDGLVEEDKWEFVVSEEIYIKLMTEYAGV